MVESINVFCVMKCTPKYGENSIFKRKHSFDLFNIVRTIHTPHMHCSQIPLWCVEITRIAKIRIFNTIWYLCIWCVRVCFFLSRCILKWNKFSTRWHNELHSHFWSSAFNDESSDHHLEVNRKQSWNFNAYLKLTWFAGQKIFHKPFCSR